MIDKRLERQQEFIGPRQARKEVVLVRLHQLGRLGKDCCRSDHCWALVERPCQSRVAMVAAAIDQQQVERDDAGFEARDRLDEGGQIGARQRVASLRHGVVVDGHDGDRTRRGSCSARKQAQIGQRGMQTLPHDPAVT